MGSMANSGEYYESIGMFYAADLLHFEKARIIESVKRPNVSQSLKSQWTWQYIAICEATDAIYEEPEVPPYITLETLGNMYEELSLSTTGTISQRFAIVADTLQYYRDLFKNYAA